MSERSDLILELKKYPCYARPEVFRGVKIESLKEYLKQCKDIFKR